MTPFIFHWRHGILNRHAIPHWDTALVCLDDEFLVPRDAIADIRMHLKPINFVIRVQMLVIGEQITNAMERSILLGEPGKVAYFNDLINTGRAI